MKEYIGEYKDGLYHGQGTWTHPDGDKYEGEFKDGLSHGQGTYTYADGKKYVGEFKDNKPWNGTGYDKYGNVKATFSNGVGKSR